MLSRQGFRQTVACLCAVGLSLALLPTELLAESKSKLGWDNVMLLRSGEHIRVETKDDKFDGRLDSANEESVALTTKDGGLLIPRDSVNKVRRSGRNWLAGALLVGGGVLCIAFSSLFESVGDSATLSHGQLPKDHSILPYEVGAGAIAAGAIVLWKGGAGTVYIRPPSVDPAVTAAPK